MSVNDLEAPIPGNVYTIQQTLSEEVGLITALVWSPDGQYLAVSTLDGFIYLWDGKTGALLHTLLGLNVPIWNIIWSLDNQRFVTSNLDGTIDLWDARGGTRSQQVLREHTSLAWSMAWSSDGRYLALGSLDQTICIWDTQKGSVLHTLSGHTEPVIAVDWSSDGRYLASGSLDQKVCVWDPMTGDLIGSTLSTEPIKKVVWLLNTHELIYTSLNNTITRWNVEAEKEVSLFTSTDDLSPTASGWSRDGRIVAIDDISSHTIVLLDIEKNYSAILEGLIGQAKLLTFSADGRRLAAFTSLDVQSLQNTINIWRKNADTWVCESSIKNISAEATVAFHPDMEAFAVVDKANGTISIFRRDETTYSMDAILADTVSYKNAKVVLVGDTGVGKTGLAHVLAGEPFRETSSSHGRHIWTFDEDKVYRKAQCVEIREVFLWDLAGQPGYRLIHQLHLDAVTIALMVFDARSETKPFTGVEYWERALRQARSILMTSTPMPEIKKFLVEARVDRGGNAVSSERINSFMQEHGFEAHFKTSARDNLKITELKVAIKEAIVWDELPGVSSTRLFQTIKTFLIEQKKEELFLESIDNLYLRFLDVKGALSKKEELRPHFERCIDRLEAVGLIKRLSFGDLILLQPEVLDAYASALISAVRDEPDGYGIITEERVRRCDFFISADERLVNKKHEQLLLIALIEDLLRRELVLREEPFLVFPAQSTHEYPDIPDNNQKTVVFTFDGPVLNIYITLVVRLANSGIFKRNKFWKNAVSYVASEGGECGILLTMDDEGHGDLALFFDKTASELTRHYFELYVCSHLERKLLGPPVRKRIFICSNCGRVYTDDMVQKRLARGLDWLNCFECDTRVSLLDKEKRLSTPSPTIQSMDHIADRQRDSGVIRSSLEGKRASNSFDVFLWCSLEDKPTIRKYRNQLLEEGILPWVDDWELQPGYVRQEGIENSLKLAGSAAVFFGKGGTKSWLRLLERAFIQEFFDQKRPLIPVILPEATELTIPDLSSVFQGMTWVDFRRKEPDPFESLLWGITGKRPDWR